jgi:citrate synthase
MTFPQGMRWSCSAGDQAQWATVATGDTESALSGQMGGPVKRSESLSAVQAAELLGVRRETLYAYVSRGLLVPERSSGPAGGRRSHFDRRQVERLAARHRRGGRSGSLEVNLDSELTLLDPAGRLYYRGRDVSTLATALSPEQVAELLWGAPAGSWLLGRDARDAVEFAVRSLPSAAGPLDRIVSALVAVAALDPDRASRDPQHVHAAGRRAMSAAALALPRQREVAAEPQLVDLLWWFAVDRAPGAIELRAMSAAMVLLADHELAASTLAARVAASTWCDPYAAVIAGLSAVTGVLHGRAGLGAVEFLRRADRDGVEAAVGSYRSGPVPGFGHRVYTGADPRADALMDLLPAIDPDRWPLVEAMVEAASRTTGREPNVDFALAAFTFLAGLRPDTPLVVFAVARIAGLVAHVGEEYAHRLRFRPRAVYVGPEPGDRSQP